MDLHVFRSKLMHQVFRILARVADRYAPSRILSFDLAHVFKTLQLMEKNKTSRTLLVNELKLGEGSVKTLVKHLKMSGMVKTSNAGMRLTNKGKSVYAKLHSAIPAEMDIPKCSIALGKFNHAVLVKGLGGNVRSGIEQRDTAIKIGAVGATTLIFKDGKFWMPDGKDNALQKDLKIRTSIIKGLDPHDYDIIIIGSAEDKKTAEIAAKSSALQTIADHEKHL